MTSKHNRSLFLAANDSVFRRQKLGRTDQENEVKTEILGGIFQKLANDDRLEPFRELLASRPQKVEAIIEEIVKYYTYFAPRHVEPSIQDLKGLNRTVSAGIRLLKKAFSTSAYKIPQGVSSELMNEPERLSFLKYLDKAEAIVEFNNKLLDRELASVPTSRKKKGSRKRFFGLNVGQLLKREFDDPHDQYVADLIDVLFEGGESHAVDTVRLARQRWEEKKQKRRAPKIVMGVDRELLPYAAEIQKALGGEVEIVSSDDKRAEFVVPPVANDGGARK